MEKLLSNTLSLLGLTPKEVKFFLTCFTIGPATINDIKKAARLERSTAYLIAEELIKRGLIEEDFRNYKKMLRTVEPRVLLRLVSARQRVFGRNEIDLKEHIGELNSLYQASEITPKVRVLQGMKGLLSVQEDILNAKEEILLWTNQETESQIFTDLYHKKFIENRIQRLIPIKVLAVNNIPGEKLLINKENLLREVKLLPTNIQFNPESYIYDNKIAILDYKKDIIGIIIESEPIAQAQRAIFEMSWNSLP